MRPCGIGWIAHVGIIEEAVMELFRTETINHEEAGASGLALTTGVQWRDPGLQAAARGNYETIECSDSQQQKELQFQSAGSDGSAGRTNGTGATGT